jgi:hypothetical protein
MKKLTAFCIFCILTMPGLLPAQASASYGIKAGMNLSQHYGTKGDEGHYEVETGLRPGFVGGAYIDFAASEDLSLGFEAIYSMKGSYEEITIRYLENGAVLEELEKPAQMDVKYFLDYLELPVLFKLKVLQHPGWELSAITGTAVGIKLKGYHELKGKIYLPNSAGGFDAYDAWEESRLSDVNMFDFSFVYGGALRIKSKLPLHLEYRFTLGWDYISLPTYAMFDPVELRNQTWSLILSSTF